MLYAEQYVDRYKANPLEAAVTLADIWCKEHTDYVDVWGCEWPCEEFFEAFLDRCRENGFLKESLKIGWCVHNCPGPETEPCHSEYVYQQVLDYSKKYGMESETLHLKERGLDKFKLFDDINKLFKYEQSRSSGWSPLAFYRRMAYDVYPNPKDEEGRFIPLIKDKDGKVIPWPRHEDGRFWTPEELDVI